MLPALYQKLQLLFLLLALSRIYPSFPTSDLSVLERAPYYETLHPQALESIKVPLKGIAEIVQFTNGMVAFVKARVDSRHVPFEEAERFGWCGEVNGSLKVGYHWRERSGGRDELSEMSEL